MGNILQAQRRAVLIRQDQVAVLVAGAQLIVGVDGDRVIFAVEAALGTVDVAVANQRVDIFQRQLARGERDRVHLHADRRLMTARQRHHADARDLRQLQRHAGIDQILHLRQRQGI